MSDGDADIPLPEPAAARPTSPKLSGQRRPGSSRPARPGSRAKLPADEELPEVEPPPEPGLAEPVVAETVVVAPPPGPIAPSKPKRPPLNPGSAAFRKTLLPPCVTLAVGCVLLGCAYFIQPADAALRQISPGIPVALIAMGLACAMTAGVLWRSLRRIDSPGAHS
jgi:hypothetical protein